MKPHDRAIEGRVYRREAPRARHWKAHERLIERQAFHRERQIRSPEEVAINRPVDCKFASNNFLTVQ